MNIETLKGHFHWQHSVSDPEVAFQKLMEKTHQTILSIEPDFDYEAYKEAHTPKELKPIKVKDEENQDEATIKFI